MKVKLTEEEALEIFAQRSHVQHHESNVSTSKQLAIRYRISERTIRDIWARRTRRDLTQLVWTAEEHAAPLYQKKQGRPCGAKDGVSRQRPALQAPSDDTPSDITQSSSSDSTSEDCSMFDAPSSNDSETRQGHARRNPPPASLEQGRLGLLFNQGVHALLLQGVQPPPCAPSNAPCPDFSQIRSMPQSFANAFSALRPPAVPPFTSHQQVQASLFNGTLPHALLSLQQPSNTIPPPSVLDATDSFIKVPHVPHFMHDAALSLEPPSQQLQAQQASAHLSQANPSPLHPPSQFLDMLYKIVPPSSHTKNSNMNAAQQFQFPVPQFAAANQAQATHPSFAAPATRPVPAFNPLHVRKTPQDFLDKLPNGGVVPGGESAVLGMMAAGSDTNSFLALQQQQQQPQTGGWMRAQNGCAPAAVRM